MRVCVMWAGRRKRKGLPLLSHCVPAPLGQRSSLKIARKLTGVNNVNKTLARVYFPGRRSCVRFFYKKMCSQLILESFIGNFLLTLLTNGLMP